MNTKFRMAKKNRHTGWRSNGQEAGEEFRVFS